MSLNVKNLGRALSILAHQEAAEHAMHADVDAFHAPSECHDDVARGEGRRRRRARRHAEGVAGAPLKLIVKEARRRGGLTPLSGDPRWQAVVGRVLSGWWAP